MAAMPVERVPSVRLVPDSQSVLTSLGLLADMAGTWEGHGFNLIARPDHEQKENLYLQLNQTDETLKFDPIWSAIPNMTIRRGNTSSRRKAYPARCRCSVLH